MSLSLQAAQKLAVITKSQGDVAIRKDGEKKFAAEGRIGTVLNDGDELKTGKDGYVALVFLDDKSQVKLLENCALVVHGERADGALNKELTMDYGKLKAEVNKQHKGNFKIATPTSVASVKGTDFWIISDASNGDMVIGLSGLVELMNLASGNVVTVGANQSGSSSIEGSVIVIVTNPEDIPVEEVTTSEDEPSQLHIEYQNADGDIKEVIIDYR